MRTLLLILAGCTFEVRLISLKTQKAIPGRLIHSGNWWYCRPRYLAAAALLKPGYSVKMQAVRVTRQTTGAADTNIEHVEKVSENVHGIDVGEMPVADPLAVRDQKYDGPEEPPLTHREFVRTHVEGELPATKGNHPRNLPWPEHDCNDRGPMKSDPTLGYRPTCTVCGGMQ